MALFLGVESGTPPTPLEVEEEFRFVWVRQFGTHPAQKRYVSDARFKSSVDALDDGDAAGLVQSSFPSLFKDPAQIEREKRELEATFEQRMAEAGARTRAEQADAISDLTELQFKCAPKDTTRDDQE